MLVRCVVVARVVVGTMARFLGPVFVAQASIVVVDTLLPIVPANYINTSNSGCNEDPSRHHSQRHRGMAVFDARRNTALHSSTAIGTLKAIQSVLAYWELIRRTAIGKQCDRGATRYLPI